MRETTVELLNDEGNGAVLKLPGRAFPGILIQGDTLQILIDDLEELLDLLGAEALEEPRESLDGIIERLKGYRTRYVEALKNHGISVPFSSR